MKRIKAVIFDMDGVISDTQKIHAEIESELLRRFGINLSPELITERYAGCNTAEFFKDLLYKKGATADVAALMNEKWDRMIELAKKHTPEIPGAVKLINDLHREGFKLAVASASTMEFVKTVVAKLEIGDRFVALTSSQEVKRGKPSPDVFLLAAERLCVKPEECVVIEDGYSGMEGAKNAGMMCVGLVQSNNRTYPADITVNSLEELTVDRINFF